MTRRKNLSPARLVPPGRILRRELDARGWTQKEFSEMIDLSEKAISAIVNGKKQITPETALKFAAALGDSAQFWLNLEANYRLHLAQRETDEAELEEIRAQSAARDEGESSHRQTAEGDQDPQEEAMTLELPVERSLEAELVQAARREGLSLETFVAEGMREKIYGSMEASAVPHPNWPRLSDAAWRAMVGAGVRVEAEEINEQLFARWVEQTLEQVTASLQSGHTRDALDDLKNCEQALRLPGQVSPLMQILRRTVKMLHTEVERNIQLQRSGIDPALVYERIQSQLLEIQPTDPPHRERVSREDARAYRRKQRHTEKE